MPDIPFLIPAQATFRTPVPDPMNPRAGDWLQEWDHAAALSASNAVFVGAPLSRTSLSHSGAMFLPREVRRVLLDFSTYSSDYDIDITPFTLTDVGDIQMSMFNAQESHDHIEEAVFSLLQQTPFVITMGGDHSITRPLLSAHTRRAGAPLGLVQFDAHHDVRILDNGPSNGTPIRGAIERGAILGQHVAQVGIHGFSNARVYAEYLRQQDIAIYTMGDIRRRGMDEIITTAYARASAAPGGVYVTVDMDVLERGIAPGCPASTPGGMAMWEMQDALFWLGLQDGIVGIDFVEVDPTRDIADMTVKATCLALLAFIAGRAARLSRGM